MNKHAGKKIFLKSVLYNTHSLVYIWYLVASCACEVTLILTQKSRLCGFFCEDLSDLTSPTSKHMHLATSVVYDTLKNRFYPCVFVLFNPSFAL